MKDKNHENFLAQWLAGSMSDDALRQRVSSDDFEAFKKLRSAIGSLELKAPDLETNYAAIKAKKIASLDKKQSSKVLTLPRGIALAASILVIIGLFNAFVFSNEFITGYGDVARHDIGEHATVTLNAKSSVAYPNLFVLNKKVELEGEAFFEVRKGRKFTVKTALGDVEVLGTKFNVIAREGLFEVVCHQGTVQVCRGNRTKILTPGDAIRFYDGHDEQWKAIPSKKPGWSQNESTFEKMPLGHVIEALANQYNARVDYPENMKSVRFTGSFTHRDLEKALQSICIPMELRYVKSNGEIVISK